MENEHWVIVDRSMKPLEGKLKDDMGVDCCLGDSIFCAEDNEDDNHFDVCYCRKFEI